MVARIITVPVAVAERVLPVMEAPVPLLSLNTLHTIVWNVALVGVTTPLRV